MSGVRSSNRYIKFIVYMIVIVLINLAGITLFFRLDLTENRICLLYTSDAADERG